AGVADDGVGERGGLREPDAGLEQLVGVGGGGGELGLALVLARGAGDPHEVADRDLGVHLVEVDEDAVGCAGGGVVGPARAGGLQVQPAVAGGGVVVAGDDTLDGDRLPVERGGRAGALDLGDGVGDVGGEGRRRGEGAEPEGGDGRRGDGGEAAGCVPARVLWL